MASTPAGALRRLARNPPGGAAPGREYELVAFSDDWDGLPFSCKHLLSRFLPEVPVVWVETIGLRSPGLNLYDLKRGAVKLAGWLRPREAGAPLPAGLRIVDPLQAPFNHIPLVRKVNKRLLLRSLARRAPRIASRERVMITTWPFLGNLVGCLGESLSIYYRVDDFSEFPGVRKDVLLRMERELIEKADMVVASAEHLTRVQVPGKTVKYLPHGVDFEHFARAERVEGELPIDGIPRPRIGFFGLLNTWIDFDLIRKLALARPGWSFVFIGPSQISTSEFTDIPNMHFLEPVPYDRLPAHARRFDVAMIPFKLNALTDAVNPLKLLEYFSLGLPVVSTPLWEVRRHGDLAALASGWEEFGRAVERALLEDDPRARTARRELARSQSWEEKARELRGWIETALERKIVSHR